MSATITGGDSSQEYPYEAIVDRCQQLESSHEGLKKRFESFSKEEKRIYSSSSIVANRICGNNTDRRRRISSAVEMVTSDSGRWDLLTGAYFRGNPYKNLLQCMGHAVWVTRPDSGHIIFWNQAAEKLFGYKSKEIYGQKYTLLQVDEEYILVSKKIMERLKHGGTWSGQFPFRRKTGEIFMALMTQTPMYEEEDGGGGEFIGIVTVASDAAVFNSQESRKKMNGQDDARGKIVSGQGDDARGNRGVRGLNLKRISWDSRPQITSFVSDLVHLKKSGEDNNNNDNKELENPEMKSERPPRIPVKKIIQFSKSILEKRRVEEDDGLLKREATMEFI